MSLSQIFDMCVVWLYNLERGRERERERLTRESLGKWMDNSKT